MTSAAAFDRIAAQYDLLWTRSLVGRAQRDLVWRVLDRVFTPGQRVLDIGCGTGEDALHLSGRGVRVCGIDASSEMVRIALVRGVEARRLAIEEMDALDEKYDGVLSNFGALNCVPDLRPVAASVARIVRPDSYTAVCLMNRTCAQEIVHFAVRGRWRTALRRAQRSGVRASFGAVAYYFSAGEIRRAFEPSFEFVESCGIGLFVPPSYIRIAPWMARLAARADSLAGRVPFLRALADHRLYIFRRRSACPPRHVVNS